VLKGGIDIAPVYHRLPARIRAHALICFLALVLYRVMRQRLRANRSSLSPRQALSMLRQLQQHHVLINQPRVIGTGRVTAEQRDVFKALNLSEPVADSTL
jgi:transposase